MATGWLDYQWSRKMLARLHGWNSTYKWRRGINLKCFNIAITFMGAYSKLVTSSRVLVGQTVSCGSFFIIGFKTLNQSSEFESLIPLLAITFLSLQNESIPYFWSSHRRWHWSNLSTSVHLRQSFQFGLTFVELMSADLWEGMLITEVLIWVV